MYSDDDKISLIAERISQGRPDRLNHDAYMDHVVVKIKSRNNKVYIQPDSEKFMKGLGVNSRNKYKSHIESVLKDESTMSYRVANGREFYYSRKTDTVVIYNPNTYDLGTCFRPSEKDGYFYKNHFVLFDVRDRGKSTTIVKGGYSVQQEANKLTDLRKYIDDVIKKTDIDENKRDKLKNIKRDIDNSLKELGKPQNESIFSGENRLFKIKEYAGRLQEKINDAKILNVFRKNGSTEIEYKNIDKKYKEILIDCIKSKSGSELIEYLRKRGYNTAHDKVTGRIVLVDKNGAAVDLEEVLKDGKKQNILPNDYQTGIDKRDLPDLEEVREKNVGKGQSFNDREYPDINEKRQAILSDCMKSKDGEALKKRLEKRGYTLALGSENKHILVVDYKGRAIDLTEIIDEGKKQNKIKESIVIKKENLPDSAEIIAENLKKLEKRYENFNKDAVADRKDINSIYDKKRSTVKNGGEETRIEIDRDIELKNNDKKLERRIERFEKSKEDKMIQREKGLSKGLKI